MVVPTKPKPRARRSLLSRSESGVDAGTSAELFGRFTIGAPPANAQRYASNEPNSRCTARNACALRIDQPIFATLRTMPAFAASAARSRSPNFATLAGSKSRYALRYDLRLLRIVDHDKPACAPSRMR